MKVSQVVSVGDYTIQVEFTDGVKGRVNLSDLVSTGIFTVLKDENQFAKVHSNGYTIAWSEDLEIDAAAIYAEISGKDPATYFSNPNYASN